MMARAFHLRFQAPLRALPSAPLLMGHYFWFVRLFEGEGRLKEVLERFRHHPPFRISSAFPRGYLPKPRLPEPLVEETATRKALKNLRFLSMEVFQRVAKEGLQVLLDNPPSDPEAFRPAQRVRVGIDRLTGGARKGVLFTERAQVLIGEWTVYAVGEVEAHRFPEALRSIGLFGLGGGASVGLGRFEVVKEEEMELPEASSPNAYLTLSPTLPQPGKALFYRVEPYWGRFGGAYALEQPFKRPHLRLLEGSVLRERDVGGLLAVGFEGKEAYEYLWAFPLGVRV
ncbi:MAG: CRISPR-associated protein Csm4 [Thermus sp.]|uniref:type III-A CRISPR-associated RAMP protein Csm4 n=1 Tax=Thermus sp. TaxID=275 RepID=UPI003319AE26